MTADLLYKLIWDFDMPGNGFDDTVGGVSP